MNLNSLNMFVLVVQHGGFSNASRKANIPVATLSRNLSELEKQLEIRLLVRSTRHIRTTREGDLLYQAASNGLEQINAGLLALIDTEEQLRGTLRLSVPPNLCFWWDFLREFQLKYQNVNLDVFTTERRIDLVADGIDVAVRIGELKSLSAVARKIMEYRHVVVCSPIFIKKYGAPLHPEQLISFPCGAWNNGESKVHWVFANKKYPIVPRLKVNDYAQLLNNALAGETIVELPPQLAESYLKSEELIELLPALPLPMQSLHLLYPSRKYLSPISRAYIDFALNYFNLL